MDSDFEEDPGSFDEEGGEDEFNGGEEEEEEEDFDFGDGGGSEPDDGDAAEEVGGSLGMMGMMSQGDDDFGGGAGQQGGLGKTFRVMSMLGIISGQNAKVDKIHEVLGIAHSFARILLVHYGWDEDKLLSHFFERGIEYVYKSAGVVAPPEEDSDEQQEDEDEAAGPASKSRKKEVSCESCMDDVPEDNTTKLNCGHRFCNDCYQTYVAMKINEGQANAITCMAYKCNTKLDETLIPKLVDDPVVLGKYNKTLAESYVNDNPMVKWCTSVPHCGNAIEALWTKQIEAQCECFHRFCFNCLKEPHSPLPCKLLPQWLEKCQGEGETFKYIAANTKDCPKCHTAVEKNGGCNLMTCRCGTFFCWLCGAQTGQAHTWEKISGHSCGKYTEKEQNADDARVSLERYMHYYTRYKAHSDSSVLEAQMRTTLLDKVKVLLEKTGTFTAYEEKWLARALEMLFECRRVLKWSYVLAYFIFGDEGKKKVDNQANKAHKMLFEDHQEQLETTTEILSKKLETPPQEMDHNLHLDIMHITVLAERRCKGLYDIILSDILSKGAYGFDVSPYSFSLELSSLHSIHERLSTSAKGDDEKEDDDDKKGKGKEKETSQKPSVSLNSPVAKIARKKDDDARTKLWEARRIARGAGPEEIAKADAAEQQRVRLGAPRTKKEEEEALKQVLEMSEQEMLRRAAEQSEKELLEKTALASLEDEKEEKKAPETNSKIKKKTSTTKRKREEDEEDLDDAESEMMRQAIAASVEDF